MKVTLTHYTDNPLKAIEEAACNCYNSEPTKTGAIAKSCIKSGHLAVTEFADFTFHIDGVSRALLAQITRHRLASFAVRSQRYCDESHPDYVIPPQVQKNPTALSFYKKAMDDAWHSYATLQKLGIENEDARMVLPNACHTTMEIKMNLRELMHFMNERLCVRAQWEIRGLAMEMKRLVLETCPELEPFLVPKCEINPDFPFCTEHNCCGRHKRLKDIENVK